MLPIPPLGPVEDMDCAGDLPVVTWPARYVDTEDMFDCTSLNVLVSDVVLSELSASALFCLFAKVGMCRCGLDVWVCSGGLARSSAVEVLDVCRPWKECFGEVTERRLSDRRKLPRSMLVAECECLCLFEVVRVGMSVDGIDVSLGARLCGSDLRVDVSSLLVGERGSGFLATGGLVVAGAPLLLAVLATGGGELAATTCAAFSFASLALLELETNRDPVLENSLEVEDCVEDEGKGVLFGDAPFFCIAPSFLPPLQP